ncbi:hypothetical protein OIU13_11735 [Brevundimonas sp. BT-123]|uniref:hypothetical protein n=1 Tax=Brevundimonas sp. BT-123 TaxID=2986928 RepID=UPI00223678A4|nr:hypothetical protein [Brevundimonas sp. BT-123]MCW0047200.1 hypothetical protein [Brevundimonas sp. BT-123]
MADLSNHVPIHLYPQFVEVSRDKFYRLEAIVADPRLRAMALDFAAKRKARRRYALLKHLFVSVDTAGGAISLTERGRHG